MPALVNPNPSPELLSWTEHPVTTEPLDWAPFAKFNQPGGKQELANKLKDAVKLWGFWTVINTGISQEQLSRQLDIGCTFFKQPLVEKKKVLPEEDFVEKHHYDKPSEDHLRYMIYHPRPAEEDAKTGGQWSPGHTDFGAMTLLFSQSVAAYEPQTTNGTDTLSFLTKGYIKSTVHRVVRPPVDQANLERLGLFYFVRPGDDIPMVAVPSPVLIREELLSEEEARLGEEQASDAVKGFEYVRARVKNVHNRNARHVQDGKGTQEVFRVKNLEVQDFYA
ncbi:2og-Fe oxygenase family protein [Lentinula raphanica]|nr:2og-Fe oxygenase family protein [Lentinula raphanica]